MAERVELKIMVVDDAEFSRKIVAEILSEEGFNVVGVAKSAEEALQLSFQTKPNLFIIDIVMPEISGLELAKIIQDKITGEKYTIMMSSLSVESIVIESISNGAIDFLQKPFSRDELVRAVAKIDKLISKDP
jgi:two-component system, chemotaxis family, chemotaxis protein CheY